MFSRELEVGEVEQISRCEADLQGDVVSWTEGQWDLAGGVTVTTGQFQQLCEKNFAQNLVIIPEPVTFQQVRLGLVQFARQCPGFRPGSCVTSSPADCSLPATPPSHQTSSTHNCALK